MFVFLPSIALQDEFKIYSLSNSLPTPDNGGIKHQS